MAAFVLRYLLPSVGRCKNYVYPCYVIDIVIAKQYNVCDV